MDEGDRTKQRVLDGVLASLLYPSEMRRTRALGFGLLLGPWAGCSSDEVRPQDSAVAPSSSVVEPDVAAGSPVGAWVRVDQWCLLTAPNPDAELDTEPELQYRIAEVIAVEGEFVKLRNLAVDPEDLCESGADRTFELHFFAQIENLSPVLVKPKIVEFDGGTKLEFAPGVRIDLGLGNVRRDVPKSEPSLVVGGVEFVVPLSPDEIGWWFHAAPAQVPAEPVSTWRGTGPLYYGERSFEPDASPPFVDVHARRSLDDRNELLTFADACGRFTLRDESDPASGDIPKMARNFDPDKVARNAGSLPVRLFSEDDQGECRPVWHAALGVALTWFEAEGVAGVTRAAVQLPKHAREMGGKVCFLAADIPVCIASDQLTRTDPDCRPVGHER